MNFSNLININQILLNCEAGSKKKSLEIISQLVSDNFSEFTTNEILDSLIQRERLGSTGIGHGVALPHGRLQNCTEAIGVFISLHEGIDFDAIDREPVRLLFALLVPEDSTEEHLEILAKLAEFFRQEKNRKALEHATSSETVYNILNQL